MNMLTDIVGD